MQLHPSLQSAINEQIAREYLAHFGYLSLASAADAQKYTGMRAWFDAAGAEELTHAKRLIDYIRARSGAVQHIPPPPPPSPGLTPLDWFKAALTLERQVSAALQAIVDLARQVSDEATARLAGDMLDEQVTAEDELAELILRVNDLQATPGLLRLFDQELAE